MDPWETSLSPLNLVKLMIQKRPGIIRDKTKHLEMKVKLTIQHLSPGSLCSTKKHSQYNCSGQPPSGYLSMFLGIWGGDTGSHLWHFSCGVPGVVGPHLTSG